MNKEQAIHVLELIRELYPRYTITKDKAKMLIPALLPMDYERVRGNLAVYVAQNPYAPTIAEIAAYPVREEEQVSKIDVWREEAADVPFELRKAYQQKMIELLGEKINDRN